jgi:acyl carrier protein
MTVAQRIASILTGKMGIPADKIVPSADLQTLGMIKDSLAQIELGLELEIEFGIDCEREPFTKVRTLGELEFEIERFLATGKQARAA